MNEMIGKPVVIRGYYCGCWAGVLEAMQVENRSVKLSNACRLWNWTAKEGICLSAIANNGVSGGKISKPVKTVILTDSYEIIESNDDAIQSIYERAKAT